MTSYGAAMPGQSAKTIRYIEKGAFTNEERSRLWERATSAAKLCALLGVSQETAREILSPQGRLTPSTLARVRAKMQELGL